MTDETDPHWSNSALLTIDLQRDFSSDSPHGIAGTSEVLPPVETLTRAFREAHRPIVHVVRIYLPDGSNADISRRSLIAGGASVVCPGSPGVELAPGLAPEDGPLDTTRLLRGDLAQVGPVEYVMYKPRWNAFFGTGLDDWLRTRSVDTVAVAGCNFPNCPRGTFFGASERDFRAVAVADAISGWTVNAQAELAAIGVHAATVAETVEALTAALVQG